MRYSRFADCTGNLFRKKRISTTHMGSFCLSVGVVSGFFLIFCILWRKNCHLSSAYSMVLRPVHCAHMPESATKTKPFITILSQPGNAGPVFLASILLLSWREYNIYEPDFIHMIVTRLTSDILVIVICIADTGSILQKPSGSER